MGPRAPCRPQGLPGRRMPCGVPAATAASLWAGKGQEPRFTRGLGLSVTFCTTTRDIAAGLLPRVASPGCTWSSCVCHVVSAALCQLWDGPCVLCSRCPGAPSHSVTAASILSTRPGPASGGSPRSRGRGIHAAASCPPAAGSTSPVGSPLPLSCQASLGLRHPVGDSREAARAPVGAAPCAPSRVCCSRGFLPGPSPSRRELWFPRCRPSGDAKQGCAGERAGEPEYEPARWKVGVRGSPRAFPRQRPTHREVSIYGKTQEAEGSSRNCEAALSAGR